MSSGLLKMQICNLQNKQKRERATMVAVCCC
ncbi:hypothetical protein RDI58_004637 [Solanum bulbocastanum]|uniref:Uncharacterized protein n=1 Tax=Solanum bulbocastanum TaxID=147425 RepID=A0AAN8U4X7_SOLBU